MALMIVISDNHIGGIHSHLITRIPCNNTFSVFIRMHLMITEYNQVYVSITLIGFPICRNFRPFEKWIKKQFRSVVVKYSM